MRQCRALILAVFVVCIASAAYSAPAYAEEKGEQNKPAILILSGQVKNLEFAGTDVSVVLATLESNNIEAKDAEVHFKGCLPFEGSELDTNLCHEGLLLLEGTKLGAANCSSETLAGVKDAAGVVLAKLDVHLAAEQTAAKVLEPLLVLKFLNVDGDNDVEITCGLVKAKVLGRIGCLLLPGLAVAEFVEVRCKTQFTEGVPNGDQDTGTCTVTTTLCTELAGDPFGVDFGAGQKMASLWMELVGKFNKDIFVDD
jgi:hypothetical protein